MVQKQQRQAVYDYVKEALGTVTENPERKTLRNLLTKQQRKDITQKLVSDFKSGVIRCKKSKIVSNDQVCKNYVSTLVTICLKTDPRYVEVL